MTLNLSTEMENYFSTLFGSKGVTTNDSDSFQSAKLNRNICFRPPSDEGEISHASRTQINEFLKFANERDINY